MSDQYQPPEGFYNKPPQLRHYTVDWPRIACVRCGMDKHDPEHRVELCGLADPFYDDWDEDR